MREISIIIIIAAGIEVIDVEGKIVFYCFYLIDSSMRLPFFFVLWVVFEHIFSFIYTLFSKRNVLIITDKLS